MFLSLLLKTEKSKATLLPDRDFEYWYSQNKVAFWLLIALAIFVLALIAAAVFSATEESRAEARKKREAKRLERDEAVKKELERISRCEVTLIFCYDDKTKTIVHKKNLVFNPEFPSREGYSFDGWYTDSARTTPFQNKAITDNLTLYAKWTKEAD
ncbi:MAG: InlB B-repeat-containing protein [Clostridia bacterium]|nr:InlB B-repeat-containing protein [Clostridia bacterium]